MNGTLCAKSSSEMRVTMKKLFIILFIATSAFLFGEKQGIEAKSVAINDKNFPDFCFQLYVKERFDTNDDGKLSDRERADVTEIYIRRLKQYHLGLECAAPSTLKGIEFFPNLERLDCAVCRIEYLDLSKNKKLEELNCSFNKLMKLNLKNNTQLKILDCLCINLKKLDVSNNRKLQTLHCSCNKLRKLNLEGNAKLKDLDVSVNKIKELEVTNLKNLIHFECQKNQLKQLDMTHNKKLGYMICNTNKLIELDVSQNTELSYLDCADNAIRQLVMGNNKSLQTLYCEKNQLLTGNINLSQNQFGIYGFETSPQEATIKIKKIGRYYYIPLPNVADTSVISNLSYGELTSKGIRVKKSTLPKTITYSYNMFTDGDELTKVTIHTKK